MPLRLSAAKGGGAERRRDNENMLFKKGTEWKMPLEHSFTSLPTTVHALLDWRAARHPDSAYVVMGERRWTYGEVADLSRRLAGRLAAGGVCAGDRVLVLMPASILQLGLWFAISRLGAIEAPVNPAYKGILLRQLIETAEPAFSIVDETFQHEFRQASDGLLAPGTILRTQDLEDGVAGGLPVQEAGPRDTSCIIFTSGTTGRSKGVMMSHSQQLSFGLAFAEIVELAGEDVTYNFLPFFHIAAKFVALGTIFAGGRMLLRAGFSVSSFWGDVRAHGVTVCAAVGGLCHMLNSQPRRADDADNPLRLIYAVPVPWEFKSDFEQRFGVDFVEGYGGTECNLVAYSRPSDPTPRSACGRPSPHFHVEVQNELGYPAAPGEPGEICIRPKYPGTMTSGYIGMPDKTLETMGDLWFHTGDRGYFDENGYLFFLDRLKDAIRRRGENISSFEVERVLNAYEAVAESAVVPVPSELGEDEVKAFVVLKRPGAVSEEDLFRYAADNMPYFMVPRFIEFCHELPRTPTMKIRKTELRAAGNGLATWDCEKAGLRVGRSGVENRGAPVAKAQQA
jgi:crotonobetaine/carnitine-CoA ligase